MARKPPRSTEERLARAQRSMTPGTLGGRVAAASPMAVDQSRLPPRLRAKPHRGVPHTWTKLGAISSASTGARLLHNDTGGDLVIRSVRPTLGTAPSTQPVQVDVIVAGSSVFTGSLPQVAVGATVGAQVIPTYRWIAGAQLRVDVTQGDAAAADLQVLIVTD